MIFQIEGMHWLVVFTLMCVYWISGSAWVFWDSTTGGWVALVAVLSMLLFGVVIGQARRRGAPWATRMIGAPRSPTNQLGSWVVSIGMIGYSIVGWLLLWAKR